MGTIELIITALALAMDAFAVAICKGLCVQKLKVRHCLITGAYFGGFQALMPLIGFFLVALFKDYIEAFDHWVAFGLLAIIGANMIAESFKKEEEKCEINPFAFKTMIVMAIATSIDALAVGGTFAVLGVNIALAVTLIGAITFVTSAVGVKIGNYFGAKHKSKAELAGGIILILLGLKILLQHLGVLPF